RPHAVRQSTGELGSEPRPVDQVAVFFPLELHGEYAQALLEGVRGAAIDDLDRQLVGLPTRSPHPRHELDPVAGRLDLRRREPRLDPHLAPPRPDALAPLR